MTSITIRIAAAALAFAATTATVGGIDRLAGRVVHQASAAVAMTQTQVPVQRIEIVGKRLSA